MRVFSHGKDIQGIVIPNFYSVRIGVDRDAEKSRRSRLFLCTGALDKRKNYDRIIEAFVESGLATEGYHLAIVGPRGNSASRIIEKVERAPNVRYLGFVSRADLLSLYGQARALIFPSLFEGFGVPAIEAPALGVLPLISGIPPLLEITGPRAVIVDPYSVRDIAHGMRSIAEMTVAEYASRLLSVRRHQERFSLVNYQNRWREYLGPL
jgi:glycosyltransferase involved in cell wall biosynthesis